MRDNGKVAVYYSNDGYGQQSQDYVPVAQQPQKPYVPEHRIIHFDLKGAPPSIDYMKKVTRISKDLGATGVLIEYEDMFPWTGR